MSARRPRKRGSTFSSSEYITVHLVDLDGIWSLLTCCFSRTNLMSRIEDLTHLNCPISRKQIILQTINVHKLCFFENKDRLKSVYYDNS